MTQEGPLSIALVGDCRRLADIVAWLAGNGDGPERSGLRLTAVAGRCDPETSRLLAAKGVALAEDPSGVADRLARVDAILVAGNGAAGIRPALPPGVPVLDEDAGRFLARLLRAGRLDGGAGDQSGARSMLAAIIDQMRDDVLLLDRQGVIVDCNKNFCESKGRAKEDILGRHFSEVLDGDENLCLADGPCPFQAALRGKRAAEAEYTRVDGQGRLRRFRLRAHPVFDAQGLVTHVAEIRRDITRRAQMEDRLNQSQKLAAIGELSTFLAHEIRNPLFTIAGFANSLMRFPNLDPAARKKVEIILAESRRLDEILKDILNFTRPTGGRVGEVDVNAVVRETMNVMKIGCEHQNIALEVEAAPGLAHVKGDEELVKQCLINLVRNAMEAMPDGGKLTVSTRMDQGRVRLSVADTGVGIPEEHLDKVFNPFFSTKDKGAGLGLAMIRKIVGDLGGDVELESREGKGTRVDLILPPILAVPEALAGASSRETADEAAAGSADGLNA